MKPAHSLLFITVAICTTACHQEPTMRMGLGTYNPDSLKQRVIEYKEISAYDSLGESYMWAADRIGELAPYSLYIASKENYPIAYYDVYISIRTNVITRKDLVMDKETADFAIGYLKKAYYLHLPQAQSEIGKMYLEGKYLPKDSVLGRQMIDSARIMLMASE